MGGFFVALLERVSEDHTTYQPQISGAASVACLADLGYNPASNAATGSSFTEESVQQWRAESGAIQYSKLGKATRAELQSTLDIQGKPRLMKGSMAAGQGEDFSVSWMSEEVCKALESWGSRCDVAVQAGVEVAHPIDGAPSALDPDGAIAFLPHLGNTLAVSARELKGLLKAVCSEVYTCMVKHRWRRNVDYTEEQEDEDELLLPLQQCSEILGVTTLEALQRLEDGVQVVLTVAPQGATNVPAPEAEGSKRRLSKAERKRVKKNSAGLAAPSGAGSATGLDRATASAGGDAMWCGGAAVVIRKEDEDTIALTTPLDRLCSYLEALEVLL